MSNITHLSFEVLPDGRVECHYRYENGSMTSFDTAQLPDKVAPLVADLAAKQQERIAELVTVAAQVPELEAALVEEQGTSAATQAKLVAEQEAHAVTKEELAALAEPTAAEEPTKE